MENGYEKIKTSYNTLLRVANLRQEATGLEFRDDGIYWRGEKIVARKAVEGIEDDAKIGGYVLALAHLTVTVFT